MNGLRGIAAPALALCLLGCAPEAVNTAETVTLLTGGSEGCYPGPGPWAGGQLLADPPSGTAIEVDSSGSGYSPHIGLPIGSIVPVMWPTGYTARRAGTEVEVLNLDGEVVATTGRRVLLGEMPLVHPPGAFAACSVRESDEEGYP